MFTNIFSFVSCILNLCFNYFYVMLKIILFFVEFILFSNLYFSKLILFYNLFHYNFISEPKFIIIIILPKNLINSNSITITYFLFPLLNIIFSRLTLKNGFFLLKISCYLYFFKYLKSNHKLSNDFSFILDFQEIFQLDLAKLFTLEIFP